MEAPRTRKVMTARVDEATQWWAARRRRHNAIAILIGAICFLLCAVLGSELPEVELTVFALGFQLVAVALYLMVANAAYSLGVIVERLVRPTNVQRFRSMLFLAGVTLTVAPFVAVPALVICRLVAGT